jgi:hypothetical protein
VSPSTTGASYIHIPGLDGRPICGATTGKASAAALPTCPACRARTTPAGVKPQDIYNLGHPVGRIVTGSALGIPGFPKIPGIKYPFGKG